MGASYIVDYYQSRKLRHALQGSSVGGESKTPTKDAALSTAEEDQRRKQSALVGLDSTKTRGTANNFGNSFGG